ncbi:aldo/keto reductase [Pseudonocardia dioxanivorans]|uniref:aldo/keto reductase n=1 Tax=Pseudonocardia dioxanivorans TaxID=240495 RepID=UPI000CD0025D|nr:aldo/keto reductase [Pseudonocardia dioxanivorans]
MTIEPGGTTAPVPTAPLGRRRVGRVGYGAMQLAGHTRPVADEDAVAVLRSAVELGVTHVDTAEFYGDGRVNSLIRAALAPYPDDLALVTKVGADSVGDTLVAAQRPEQLRASVEANLATLGLDWLAVVNLRRTDVPPGIVAEGDQLVDLESQLAELVALRDEGKIEGIGLSHVDADQLARALPAGIVCVQNAENLLYPGIPGVRDLCLEHHVAWVPYFPLGSGFPLMRSVADHPAVVEVARARGVTPAQVGLAWLLCRDDVTLVIPGTTSVAHLEENVAAGGLRLDDPELAALRAAV